MASTNWCQNTGEGLKAVPKQKALVLFQSLYTHEQESPADAQQCQIFKDIKEKHASQNLPTRWKLEESTTVCLRQDLQSWSLLTNKPNTFLIEQSSSSHLHKGVAQSRCSAGLSSAFLIKITRGLCEPRRSGMRKDGWKSHGRPLCAGPSCTSSTVQILRRSCWSCLAAMSKISRLYTDYGMMSSSTLGKLTFWDVIELPMGVLSLFWLLNWQDWETRWRKTFCPVPIIDERGSDPCSIIRLGSP